MQAKRRVCPRWTRIFAAIALGVVLSPTVPAAADDLIAGAAAVMPQRPAILFNRWQEDWSVLADPRVPREPLDGLKYIPLSASDPKAYLSFGADVRERFEGNDATSFGVAPNHNADYVISRLEAHTDLRLGSRIQVFTQFESAYAPGKTVLTPVDQNRLDVEQAFIVVTQPIGDGLLKLRLGRQQFAFDLERFVSVRDGPNVRQSYDAAWADYERGPCRFITFYSLPVQNRDVRAFDDYSSGRLTYGGARIERHVFEASQISAYYSRFTQDNARFPSISGNERRDILDLRFGGTASGFDWDIEAMGQVGRLADDDVRAWAFGSLAGYTFADVGWTPRVGLQVDAASGDTNPHDHRLGTFNPLFPNGYYLSLAGYTGYVNFIHVKPSITVHPAKALKLMFAIAGQWRETTADAVYTQPDIPVAGTAGKSGSYTGTYGQFRADWAMTPYASVAFEAVHFAVADVIRRAGGHNGDYLGAEIKYGW